MLRIEYIICIYFYIENNIIEQEDEEVLANNLKYLTNLEELVLGNIYYIK